jgi:hypothetical protein
MKIAFCFLIYNTIHGEDLWADFFKNETAYSVHVHYKWNVPLRHFEACKLQKCVDARTWSATLVQAQNRLLEAALEDPEISHCVFLSQACVPLKTFREVAAALEAGKSYFNRSPDEQCFPRCEGVPLPRESVKKSSQWCILAREHAALMLAGEAEYLQWFDRPGIPPDEHCYITYLHWLGRESELVETANLAEGATTFTNWAGMDYPFVTPDGLKHYSTISLEELAYLRASPCLFGRKFLPECIPILMLK